MDLIKNGRLSIFSEDFIIDFSLPKHNKPSLDASEESQVLSEFRSNRVSSPSATFYIEDNSLSSSMMFDQSDLYINVAETANLPWWKKIFTLFNYEKMYKTYGEDLHKKAEQKKQEEAEREAKKMTIGEFFSQVKTQLSDSEIQDYTDTVNNYLKQMDKALKMGQTALYEEMKASVSRMKVEAVLKAKGVKMLSEEQIVKLAQNSKRGLKIDYLRNFTRLIPDEVLEKKLQADDLLMYDNYVVVHFDPQNTGSKKTEQEKKEEKAKEKDPILFGVIAGSTNLYFVADWIDEYCDLTLEKAINIINGKEQ